LQTIEATSYIARVHAIEREFPRTGGCHDIELHRVNGKVYLSCHLLINEGVSIAEVHEIAEQLENRLRLEFPELGRVVIHTEPRSAGSA